MKVDLLKLFIEDLMTKAYHKKEELIVTPFVFRSQSSIWLIMTCNSATIYLKPRLTCTLSDMKNPICYLINWIHIKGSVNSSNFLCRYSFSPRTSEISAKMGVLLHTCQKSNNPLGVIFKYLFIFNRTLIYFYSVTRAGDKIHSPTNINLNSIEIFKTHLALF